MLAHFPPLVRVCIFIIATHYNVSCLHVDLCYLQRINNLWCLSDPEKGVALCLALLVSSELRERVIDFHSQDSDDESDSDDGAYSVVCSV
jgi:hypothetical protein